MDLIDTSEQKTRLIVLVPDGAAGDLELARKIYWLAARSHGAVTYLVMVDNEEEELTAIRRMATMKAVTAGNALLVDSVVTETSGWLKKLQSLYRPGDRIVCHAEQSVKNGFLKTLPIADFLRERLGAEVILLNGYYHPQQVQLRRWLLSLVTWLGFLAILAVFTIVEVELDPVMQGVSGKLLLGGIFTLEIGSIWAWNNIIGQMR